MTTTVIDICTSSNEPQQGFCASQRGTSIRGSLPQCPLRRYRRQKRPYEDIPFDLAYTDQPSHRAACRLGPNKAITQTEYNTLIRGIS